MSSSNWEFRAKEVMEDIKVAGGIKVWLKRNNKPIFSHDIDINSLIWYPIIQDILRDNGFNLKVSSKQIIVKSPEYIKKVLRSKMKQEFD